ncbi:MAG: NAD(P)H-binding protein [Gammaproteobacteria bacterium]|nr:NAD(P)H-binding protein [Gammaproteobacteria bacterium]
MTGATGFVGRRLATALVPGAGDGLRLLVRDPSRLAGGLVPPATVITGTILDRSTLDRATAGADTIIHLAALTGKASREAMIEANAEGTRRLLEAAKRAGTTRFLFVSTIAAGFHDRRWYHYADSKRQAELAVRESGLDWVIVRPTMVFGPGSPVQASLTRLASAPVGVVFGDGNVVVQPIHVSDLVAILLSLLQRRSFGREVVEAGGPEAVVLGDLLRRIRLKVRGRPGPMLHVPLGPLRGLLGLVDRPLWRLLPFTAGQMASFANPSVAAQLPGDLPAPRHRIDEMLDGADA